MGKISRYNYSLIFILPIFCLGFVFTSQAKAEITVSLKADRTEATLADSIRLIVSVSGSRSAGEYPSINGLDSFHVSKGGTSSRVQIINRRVDAAVDYTYFLQPQKVGAFSIGPAEVNIKGKSYQSNTIRLTVKKSDEVGGDDRGPLFLTAELSREKTVLEWDPSDDTDVFFQGEGQNTLRHLCVQQVVNELYRVRRSRPCEKRQSLLDFEDGDP